MKVPFVDLARSVLGLETEIVEAISGVVRGCQFVLGPVMESFEREYASFCDCSHGVGVASGTDALMLALKARGIGPGKDVLTAANTFIATFNAISRCGATPVPVDVDPETFNIDPGGIEDTATDRTAAVVPVHLYGRCADIGPILENASAKGIDVIEDAAQAHGALYHGKRAGSFGICGCFSFYPSKNLAAFGDGGMVVTNDAALAEKLRMLRNYGQKDKNVHLEIGFNSRLDEIQAAVLRVKLRHLEENNDLRRKAASRYRERLEVVGEVTVPEECGGGHVYHLFVIRCQERDALAEHLSKLGISTGLHYPTPPHLQPAYHHLGYRKGAFPIAEKLAFEILSLPMFPGIRDDEVDYVCENIAGFYSG